MSKTCIITGASSGIGKAVAKEFAGVGFRVIMISKNKTELKKLQIKLLVKPKILMCLILLLIFQFKKK
ncbi:MAG: SDR family NAD(P)-dependent oxidoreductase [Bacteroidales bacterium]|nr:SDR family NAD(P)-dependent oxidoreductase [Bacteroidales bacterium]